MKLLRVFPAIVVTALALAASSARAQIGVYGTFDAAQLKLPIDGVTSDQWTYGGGGGAYFAKGHFLVLSTGIDLRAQFTKGSSTANGANASYSFYSGYAGPRIGFRPHILPIQPYLEGLVGAAYVSDTEKGPFTGGNNGLAEFTSSNTKFSYQVVGGIDYTIVPRIDWRVVEVGWGSLRALDEHADPLTVSTGIVIRFPNLF